MFNMLSGMNDIGCKAKRLDIGMGGTDWNILQTSLSLAKNIVVTPLKLWITEVAYDTLPCPFCLTVAQTGN